MTRADLLDIVLNGLQQAVEVGANLDKYVLADFLVEYLIEESGLRAITETLKNS